ncbi:MAG: alpha-ketoacid dehydrogenase subunit beta [Chloroflexi bacterium]|nr:alpha-ketoacid dehydrogenase subunit beta [Chloroflexota bacterium]
MPLKTIIEVVHDTLDQEMARDNRVMILGEDVGVKGGVFRATLGLQQKYGNYRVLDTPLAESTIAGVAIGLAINGMRPVAEIQFADFILPAVNQILSEAARIRYRSNGAYGVPMVIRAPYGAGVRGGLYHSQSVETIFIHWPGLKVVVPSTPYDTKGLLISAIRDDDPVLFFEHKRTYRLIKDEVPDEDYTVPIGKAIVRRSGNHMSVFSYGMLLHFCLEAAQTLAGEGIEVEVVDLRSLRPLDTELILESARKTGKVLIVHEDNLTYGPGAEIAALIAQHAFAYLDGPIARLAAPDVPASPYASALEAWFLPDTGRITEAMRQLAAY